MKKRVRPDLQLRRMPAPAGKAVLRPRIKREEVDRPGDEPGLTIVRGPQFDALLTLLDNPPKATEELRQAFANRRWK